MSAPVVTVGPGTTVAAAARSMHEHAVAWVPVVDAAGRVVGVLGRSDLLAVFLRGDDAIRREVVEEVLGRTSRVWTSPRSTDGPDVFRERRRGPKPLSGRGRRSHDRGMRSDGTRGGHR